MKKTNDEQSAVVSNAAKKSGLIKDEMSEKIIETAERLALADGVSQLNVLKLLKELGITNRVFYNRFANIEQVLDEVYERTALLLRAGFTTEYTGQGDFFEYVTDLVTNLLVMSYEVKRRFGAYFFESDSVSKSNCDWWTREIAKLFEYAKSNKLIRDVDTETLSYAVWCFCRGYNADAVTRALPKDEAIAKFRYSFGVLLDGIKLNRCDGK